MKILIRVKVKEVVDAIPMLRELSAIPFPVVTAFKIARIMRELDNEVKTFDMARAQIVDKYCVKDLNGNFELDAVGNIKIASDKIEKCNKEIADLLNCEIEINTEKITLDELSSADIKYTVEQIISMVGFLQE